GLGELAVGDEIDAAFGLLAHALGHRLGQRRLIGLVVGRLAVELRLHQVEQSMRPRQAADMRGADAAGVVLAHVGLLHTDHAHAACRWQATGPSSIASPWPRPPARIEGKSRLCSFARWRSAWWRSLGRARAGTQRSNIG